MKFKVQTQDLAKALKLLPPKSRIALFADGNILTLQSLYGDISAAITLSCTVDKPGVTELTTTSDSGQHPFVSYIASCDAPTVLIQVQDGMLSVQYDKVKAKFPAQDYEHNRLVYDDRATTLRVRATEMLTALLAVSKFQAKTSERPVLRGVHFNIRDQVIDVVATDGYHLAVKKIAETGAIDAFTLPTETVSALERALRALTSVHTEATLEMYYSDDSVFMKCANFVAHCHPYDGPYANYTVLSLDPQPGFFVDPDEFKKALKRVLPFVGDPARVYLDIDPKDSVLAVSSRSERGDCEAKIPIEISSDKFSDWSAIVNPKYLSDALDSAGLFDPNQIFICQASSIMFSVPDASYWAFVMPIALSENKP